MGNKAGGAIAAYGGGVGGWLLKGAKNDRTSGKRANASQFFADAYQNTENYLLPYDELVRLGRVKNGVNTYGLAPNESRFSHALSQYQDALESSDPLIGKYSKVVNDGLQGIENGGIPDDMRRSITESLRSTQAQRGILDSNVGAIEEVVRLMGGSEAVRSQRLNEARAYFNDITGPAISALAPTLPMNLQLQTGAYAANQQRSQAADAMLTKQWGQGLSFASDVIGAVAGGAAAGKGAAA